MERGNSWLFLVGGSRYWFNYRHSRNLLEVKRLAREAGVPLNQIIVMDALSISLDPRNPQKDHLLSNLLASVDYREAHASVSALPSALIDKMGSDEQSNVLIYLSGHGGDQFFKFHDSQELTAQLLHQVILEMVTYYVNTTETKQLKSIIKGSSVDSLSSQKLVRPAHWRTSSWKTPSAFLM